MQVCRRCLVSGKVQGVFYRASTAERARELGVTGYAKNLPDGRVEVLACGDEAAVQQLLDWLKSPLFTPVMAILEIARVAVPVLLKMTGCAALATPTFDVNVRLVADSCAEGAGVVVLGLTWRMRIVSSETK